MKTNETEQTIVEGRAGVEHREPLTQGECARLARSRAVILTGLAVRMGKRLDAGDPWLAYVELCSERAADMASRLMGGR